MKYTIFINFNKKIKDFLKQVTQTDSKSDKLMQKTHLKY